MFVLIYIALGVADLVLMLRYSRRALDPDDTPTDAGRRAPALTY